MFQHSVVFLQTTLDLTLRPRDIRFAQPTISHRFSDCRSFVKLLEQLLHGELQPNDIHPKIEVVYYEEHWWVLNGHRRLFVLKKFQDAIDPVEVEVEVRVRDLNDNRTRKLFEERRKTTNDGSSIYVTHGSDVLRELNDLVAEWRKSFDDEVSTQIENAVSSPIETLDYPFFDFEEKYNPLSW